MFTILQHRQNLIYKPIGYYNLNLQDRVSFCAFHYSKKRERRAGGLELKFYL